MTDIPKVITTLSDKRANSISVGNNSRTYTKSPESDRPVFYNTNGFLETSLPTIRGGFVIINDVNSPDQAKTAAGFATALGGTYFDSSKTLDPCVVGPNISHLFMPNSASGDVTLTWPSVGTLAAYLRTTFPDLYRPGLAWDFFVTNNDSNNNLTLAISNETTGASVNVIGNAGTKSITMGPVSSRGVRTVVVSTTPGEELFWYFFIAP